MHHFRSAPAKSPLRNELTSNGAKPGSVALKETLLLLACETS